MLKRRSNMLFSVTFITKVGPIDLWADNDPRYRTSASSFLFNWLKQSRQHPVIRLRRSFLDPVLHCRTGWAHAVPRAVGYDFDHCDRGSVAQAKARQVRSKVALRFVGAKASNNRIVVSVGHVEWKGARSRTRTDQNVVGSDPGGATTAIDTCSTLGDYPPVGHPLE